MSTKVVVGVQWGDEGKGKVTDILASRSQVVVRAQGGNNAGHTVESGGEVYKLNLVPSGVLYPEVMCLIGCGVVVDPAGILREMDGLEARGVSCRNMRIDARAHIVMPWHNLLDSLAEEKLGDAKIGTTRRGIGPCYMDKAERTGIRMSDLCSPDILPEMIRKTGGFKNEIITKVFGGRAMDLETIITEYVSYGERLRPYMADVSVLVWEAVKAGKEILFEGAQGTLLDIDVGTYPFVTSSHAVAGGACVGVGIGPTAIDEVIGVSKAYTTRVGEGPMPTELFDETGNIIRDTGREYGTNTGRPRRVGWFDAVLLRHAIRVNGLTSLAINKLDTLRGLPTLKVCTSYQLENGTEVKDFPAIRGELKRCRPIYRELPGFEEDVSGCRSYEQLPENCKRYVALLEELCDCPIRMVGVGPARDQNLER